MFQPNHAAGDRPGLIHNRQVGDINRKGARVIENLVGIELDNSILAAENELIPVLKDGVLLEVIAGQAIRNLVDLNGFGAGIDPAKAFIGAKPEMARLITGDTDDGVAGYSVLVGYRRK